MRQNTFSLSVLLTLLCPLLASPVAAQTQTARGVVYEDSNGNGKKDRREPGIPAVAVSNGKEVVLTDEKGNYELPASDDMVISVIKPSNYRLPLNELNQPQFFYIHKASGSPKLRYAGTAPTGALPKSIDFGLTKSEEPEHFQAFVFGDPQPYNMDQISYFGKGIVSEVAEKEGRVLGISLGDIAGDNLDLHAPYSEEIARIGIPWFNVMGNHDMNYDVKEDHLSDEAFEAHFGPANYAFNYGKVHFIVLDDILYPDPRDGKGYWGGFREDQLDFVENDLKFVPKDHLIVVSFHIPLFEENGDSFRDEDRERLLSLLKAFPHTVSLSAHTHYQKQTFIDGHHHYNVGTTSGDWYSGSFGEDGTPSSLMRDGTPKGYATMTVKGNQYVFDYQPAGKPADYRMRIHSPKLVARNDRRGEIVVNFFAGGEKDALEYRVDGGPWNPMKRVEAYDPYLQAIHHEWEYASTELPSGRRPSLPILSSHIWKARIPSKLPAGEHKIEVRAKDMYGNTHMASRSYRIVEGKE